MKKILVPTDFSENAANALAYAAALAAQTRAMLVLMHAMELPIMASAEATVVLPPNPEVKQHYTSQLSEMAHNIELQHEFRFATKIICVEGSLFEHLPHLVVQEQVDLVVMGTRGASNILDRLIGTNTATFLKHAPCPVLAIPAGAKYTGIKKLAYASDFKADEEVYLRQLFSLAAPLQAEVMVVNVVTGTRADATTDSRIRDSINRLSPGCHYAIAQVKGKHAVAGIKAYVQENKVDVVAVSLHERNLLEDLFHKSVSQELAYTSTIPLLALPPKPYQAKSTTPQVSAAAE